MKPNEYLSKILGQQTFDDDEQDLKDVRKRRNAVFRVTSATHTKHPETRKITFS